MYTTNYFSEIWLPISGYEGKYEVSNYGRIRSVTRVDSENHIRKGQIMKQKYYRGYARVALRDGKKQKEYLVHRLVAIAFIPNPNNLPQVNHKDCNTKNNVVSNLEWCDASYNINYADRNKKVAEALTGRINTGAPKKVNQYTQEGVLVKTYLSAADVERMLGIASSNIIAVCKGRQKTAGKYKDENGIIKRYKWNYAE